MNAYLKTAIIALAAVAIAVRVTPIKDLVFNTTTTTTTA